MVNKEETAKKIAEMMVGEYIKNHLNDLNEKDITLNATRMYVNAYNTSMQTLNVMLAPAKSPFEDNSHSKLTPFEEKNYTR